MLGTAKIRTKPNPTSDYWTTDFENTRILLGELHNWKIGTDYGKNKFGELGLSSVNLQRSYVELR